MLDRRADRESSKEKGSKRSISRRTDDRANIFMGLPNRGAVEKPGILKARSSAEVEILKTDEDSQAKVSNSW